MTDLLDDLGPGLIAEFGQYTVAFVAAAHPGANLHEFMIAERPVQFTNEIWADAGLTDENDRLAIVS